MVIKAKTQRDYLKTEATIELPANIAEVDQMLRNTRTSGKMIVLYYNGSIQGINIEQNTKLSEIKSREIRTLLDVQDRQL